MAAISQLVDSKVFAQLDVEDMRKITAIIDAEIIKDPVIRRKLRERVAEIAPDILRASKARKGGG